MALVIEHGRRVEVIDNRPHVVHEMSTPVADNKPAATGYRLVRAYHSPLFGALCLWRKAFPVYPVDEPGK